MARVVRIGFFALLVLCFGVGSLAVATQQAYDDGQSKEFARQWKEVQENYPLVAKAFLYLQGVPLLFCNVDEKCFRAVQQNCLDEGNPVVFCFETAKKICCKPLELKLP